MSFFSFGKILDLLKKFWKPIAGFFALLSLYIFKRNYDANIANKAKDEVIDEYERVSHEQEIETIKDSEKIADETNNVLENVPPRWDDFNELRAKKGGKIRLEEISGNQDDTKV